MPVKKVLCIRFSSIGDIVLTTPVLRCLKIQLNATVHVLTKESFAPILKANPYVDRVIAIREHVREVLAPLKREHYDWVADLHHNLRSLQVKKALNRPGSAFPKLNVEKWLYVHFRLNRLPDQHIVDRYFKTVADLNVRNDGAGLDYFIPDSAHLDLQAQGYGLSAGKYAVLVTGAGLPTKALELSQMIELVKKIENPVVLLGGGDQIQTGAAIRAAFPSVVDLTGKLDLHGSASMIAQSGVVISPDTGMMHIAAAFRKPLISVWGNTIPEFGMSPYYGTEFEKSKLFEVKNLNCRPCSKIGFQTCPKGHFRCIRDLRIHEIAGLANAWLRQSRSEEIDP